MDPTDTEKDGKYVESARSVLKQHPVRLGVLFGSQAMGTSGTHSDIDIAVEFGSSVSGERRYQARLALLNALTRTLETDNVDLVDLATVRPEIGYAALTEGIVLVGNSHRVETLVERLEAQIEKPTRKEQLDRFDAVLTRLEELA